MADEALVSEAAPKGRKRLRQLGWVALAFFALKGLLWLAVAAGAWKLLD